MSEEILINVAPEEVRVALLENNILQEIHIERRTQGGIVGNIYKGRVKRILPGMQAAFVDIGLERSGFLHASDIDESGSQNDICDLIKMGQNLLVQVYKDPLGTKGPRLTTQIGLPSRYLVLTPNSQQVAVSQKINDENERQRLISLISPDKNHGYIFRTAAENISASEVEADKKYLNSIWDDLKKGIEDAQPGKIIYQEIPIVLRVLRDLASPNIQRIRVDDEISAIKMREFAQKYAPHLVECIELYTDDRPIFDIYSVEKDLQKALQRRVKLKSGGHLIFDQTEAMTTIDVNTGSYLGRDNLDQTLFKTNLEAAETIARQVRLRNIGGIIIIDFIDMVNEEHKSELLQALIKALAKDSVRTDVSEISSLGLVQMTRKRTRESLANILCTSCPLCHRRGSIKSFATLYNEIYRELKRAANSPWTGFQLLVNQAVAKYLSNEETNLLTELKQEIGKPIEIRVESSYTPENFNILPKAERNKV